jgi:hypothetical protein
MREEKLLCIFALDSLSIYSVIWPAARGKEFEEAHVAEHLERG